MSLIFAQVLRRENYRCAITRRVDDKSVGDGKTQAQNNDSPTMVDNAHILPFSLVPASTEAPAVGRILDCNAIVLTINASKQIDRSSTVWQVISAFSGISLDELNGNNINRPENGIALDHMVHRWFGELSLCFEATAQVRTI